MIFLQSCNEYTCIHFNYMCQLMVMEVQPDVKLDIGIISGTVTVGAIVLVLSCLVVIGIVISIYRCYHTRKSSDLEKDDL